MKKLDGNFRRFDTIHQRNRQTDGRTPRDSKTTLCIALRSKNGIQLLFWKVYHISKFFYGPHKHVGTNKVLPPQVVPKSGLARSWTKKPVRTNRFLAAFGIDDVNLCEVSELVNCSTWTVLQRRTRYRRVYSLLPRTVASGSGGR